MEKINIAELLKTCPKGMELDCIIFENATFEEVTDASYPIKIITDGSAEFLTEYGCVSYKDTAKCVIFPKGKTTWEGFQRPFKDGDVIFTHANCLNVGLGNTWISIFKENRNSGVATYVDYCNEGKDYYTYLEDKGLLCEIKDILLQRFATEEEKQKLFKVIKDNGYKWNPEIKTLEKLIVPKFKVGDRITNGKVSITIGYIDDNYYYEVGRNITNRLFIKNQDDWELVLDKFNISTLKPFDKVLVRNYDGDKWAANLFGFFGKNMVYPYSCVGCCARQCVPYKNNEHLLGTTNDCSDYYKNW